jgi:hypothetical protein
MFLPRFAGFELAEVLIKRAIVLMTPVQRQILCALVLIAVAWN